LLSDIRIVMLTSRGERGDAARCRGLGIAAYLNKPFDRLELRDVLLHVLAPDPAEPQIRPLVTRHTVREQLQSFSVLVAEDNVVNQRLIARLLQKRGHTVVLAQNGLEALKMLGNSDHPQPELILLDINMPKMNGWEFLEAYKKLDREEKNKKIVMILTTSMNPEDKTKAGQSLDVSEFNIKPLTPEMLKNILEKYSFDTNDE